MSRPLHILERVPGRENPTLNSLQLLRLYKTLVKEDKIRWLLYDGRVQTFRNFLDLLDNPETMTFAVWASDADEPLAFCWLNNFMGHAALFHFCFFDAGTPERHSIARAMLRHLLFGEGSQLSALMGVTPKPFRHAWNFALETGFQRLGTLPRACWLAEKERMVDAVLTLCTPESFHNAQSLQP